MFLINLVYLFHIVFHCILLFVSVVHRDLTVYALINMALLLLLLLSQAWHEQTHEFIQIYCPKTPCKRKVRKLLKLPECPHSVKHSQMSLNLRLPLDKTEFVVISQRRVYIYFRISSYFDICNSTRIFDWLGFTGTRWHRMEIAKWTKTW